jgi:hypothetical protein
LIVGQNTDQKSFGGAKIWKGEILAGQKSNNYNTCKVFLCLGLSKAYMGHFKSPGGPKIARAPRIGHPWPRPDQFRGYVSCSLAKVYQIKRSCYLLVCLIPSVYNQKTHKELQRCYYLLSVIQSNSIMIKRITTQYVKFYL